jgi:hypothetical protein
MRPPNDQDIKKFRIKISRNFDQTSETICDSNLLILKEFLQFTTSGETP